MDKNFIKIMIEEGVQFKDMAAEKAVILLNNQITEVYIKNGLHRTMTEAKFNEEIKFNAGMLYKDIMDDRNYKAIRDTELHYIFTEGMKGRLGTDKDIVITYKSLLRWIEGYVKHDERREALRMYHDERRPKPKQLPVHEMTDDERERSTREALAEYVDYRKALEERSAKASYGIKSIGEILGPPMSLNDYGGYRREWLLRNGYAKEGEKLVDVFTRAIANGGEFVKV